MLLLIDVIPSTQAAFPSTDPRCTTFLQNGGCNVVRASPRSTFHVDPTTCTGFPPNYCSKCLTGTEWTERLQPYRTKRANAWHVQVANWLTHEVVSTIFQILAGEVLGYDDVLTGYQSPNNGFQALCCEERIVMMETWPSTTMPEDQDTFSLTRLPVGYEGQSGIFVHGKTVQEAPLSTAWNAYKFLPEYKSLFPPAFNASPSELKNKDGEFICNTAPWHNESTVKCHQGHYVPPQCQGAERAPYCQEVAMADPTWDVGFFEGLVNNSKLNFTLAYYGSGRHQQRVREAYAKGEHVAFYWWEPDPFTASVFSEPIAFKSSSATCTDRQSADPGKSTADCGYPTSPLMKLARRDTLAQDPDMKHLFESFNINADLIRKLLLLHHDGGGNQSVYDLSCDWVKDNFATWNSWTRGREDSSSSSSSSEAESSRNTTLMIALISVSAVVLILLLVVAIIVFFALRRNAQQSRESAAERALRKKAFDVAPKSAPFALVVTQVHCSAMIWQHFPRSMEAAMKTHDRVVRECIEEFAAFEISCSGDSFVIVTSSVIDAALLAATMQTRLQNADWPREIDNLNDLASRNMFRGLRVRMCVHWCEEGATKIDVNEDELRVSYKGTDIKLATRIEAHAHGGQILMSQLTMEALIDHSDFGDLVKPEVDITLFAVQLKLKGFDGRSFNLYQLSPKELNSREFDPIVGHENFLTPDDSITGDSLLVLRSEAETALSGESMMNDSLAQTQRRSMGSPRGANNRQLLDSRTILFVWQRLMAKCTAHERRTVVQIIASGWDPSNPDARADGAAPSEKPIVFAMRAVAAAIHRSASKWKPAEAEEGGPLDRPTRRGSRAGGRETSGLEEESTQRHQRAAAVSSQRVEPDEPEVAPRAIVVLSPPPPPAPGSEEAQNQQQPSYPSKPANTTLHAPP